MDNRITAFEWITVDSYKGTLTSVVQLLLRLRHFQKKGLQFTRNIQRIVRILKPSLVLLKSQIPTFVKNTYMLRLLVSSFYYKSYYEFLQPALKGTTQRGLQIMREWNRQYFKSVKSFSNSLRMSVLYVPVTYWVSGNIKVFSHKKSTRDNNDMSLGNTQLSPLFY